MVHPQLTLTRHQKTRRTRKPTPSPQPTDSQRTPCKLDDDERPRAVENAAISLLLAYFFSAPASLSIGTSFPSLFSVSTPGPSVNPPTDFFAMNTLGTVDRPVSAASSTLIA